MQEIGFKMQHATTALLLLSAAFLATPTNAQDAKSPVVSVADLPWKGIGVPGVSTAVVNGDTSKGPGHFFLKYNKGFVAPLHFHSADHFWTTITGTLILTVDGKEHRLAPGSFVSSVNKMKHAARCEGPEDCVMFIDTRAAWDAVFVK